MDKKSKKMGGRLVPWEAETTTPLTYSHLWPFHLATAELRWATTPPALPSRRGARAWRGASRASRRPAERRQETLVGSRLAAMAERSRSSRSRRRLPCVPGLLVTMRQGGGFAGDRSVTRCGDVGRPFASGWPAGTPMVVRWWWSLGRRRPPIFFRFFFFSQLGA
jgi:hypothetical protein